MAEMNSSYAAETDLQGNRVPVARMERSAKMSGLVIPDYGAAKGGPLHPGYAA